MLTLLMEVALVLAGLMDSYEAINVIGNVELAGPLKCDICHSDEPGTTTVTTGPIDHYTNITVYRKDGDVILGGLFPLQLLHQKKGVIRYRNVALVEMMAWTIDRINEDNDTLPGIELGYEIRDSFNNAPFASVQALELAAKNVFGVVGPGSSKVAVHLASLLGSLSFPMITYAATSDILSNPTRFGMFARTVPSDEFQCKAIGDLIHYYKWSFVTIIHSPELYGTEGANELRNILADKGIYVDKFHSLPEVTTPQYIETLLDRTFLKNVTNVNRFPASVIVLFATFGYAMEVINSAVKLQTRYGRANMFENVTWIASESWGRSPDIIRNFNTSNIGYYIGINIKTFPVTDFVEYFRSLTPDTGQHNPWFEYYYKEEHCGGDITNCKHKFYDQGPYDEPVLLAVEAFAHTLHSMLSHLGEEKKGIPLDPCLVGAKPISNTTDLFYLRNSGIGKCLYSKLITTGTYRTRTRTEMKFDNQTGDFEAIYAYLTLRKSELAGSTDDAVIGALHDIGIWNKSGIYIDDPLVPFGNKTVPVSKCSDDCYPGQKKIPGQIPTCWSCVNCDFMSISNKTNSITCIDCKKGFRTIKKNTVCEQIPPTFLKVTHPAAIILIIISVAGMSMTLTTIAVFVKYRDTPLVKASSKELCIVLLVGIFVGFISPFFAIGEPSNPICLMQLVTGILFGTLTIVPIFLKTARVYALFFQSQRSAGRPPQYLLPVWQSMLCMLLVFVQMVLLMFVIIWYPLERKHEYPNRDTVLVVCSGATGRDTAIALSVPVGYVLCFMVLSTILSYKVRKLPSNFQEAKYICFAQTIAIIVLIAFGSSYFVTAGIWQKFLIAIASQIIAFAFLILIFYKKVEIVVFYPERNMIVFEKEKLSKLDMTRKERRISFLTSQNCHMCGQSLKSKRNAKAGLMSAVHLLGIPKVLPVVRAMADVDLTLSTDTHLSDQLTLETSHQTTTSQS